MKYQAVGTDRATGQRRAIIVEAASEQEASMEALVSLDIDQIWPVTKKQAASAWAEVSPPSAAQPPAEQNAVHVPCYTAMNIVGRLLVAVGAASLIVAVILMVLAWSITKASPYSVGTVVSTMIGATLNGLFCMALGEGIGALRDIARNSWK